jgi:hypothetical protein
MSQKIGTPQDGHEVTEVSLNAHDEKYARAVRLASHSLDLQSVLTSAAAKRAVMQQLAILESHYFYLEDTALSAVAEKTGRSKLHLLPLFRNAASTGREMSLDYRTMMEFSPTRLVLIRR